jgi:hypothetical protein
MHLRASTAPKTGVVYLKQLVQPELTEKVESFGRLSQPFYNGRFGPPLGKSFLASEFLDPTYVDWSRAGAGSLRSFQQKLGHWLEVGQIHHG